MSGAKKCYIVWRKVNNELSYMFEDKPYSKFGIHKLEAKLFTEIQARNIVREFMKECSKTSSEVWGKEHVYSDFIEQAKLLNKGRNFGGNKDNTI